MVRHSTLTGTDLHDPKGKSPTPLDLAAATTSAYLIRNSFAAAVFAIDTIGGNSRIRFGSETPLNFADCTTDYSASAGTINLYGKLASGIIQLFARDSGGTITQLTPIGAGLSGTTNLVFTVNSDGAIGSNEDPYLTLLGGDGVELVATIFRADSSADQAFIFQQLSSVADDTADRSSTLFIGPMAAFSATGIDADATLTLRGHLSGNGVSVFKDASIAIDASVNTLIFTTPSSGSYKFATGDIEINGTITIPAGTAAITVGGSARSLTLTGHQATSTGIDVIVNTALGKNGNSTIFQVQNNTTGVFNVRYTGAINITQGTPQSGFTAQPMIQCTGTGATAQVASVELLDFDFNAARVIQFSAGAITTQRCFYLRAPSYAFVSASTITTAATFYIDAAPTASTNATITNSYSMYVAAGAQRHIGGAFAFVPTTGLGMSIDRSDNSTAYALAITQASTGDATLQFSINSGATWTLGPDNSETGDTFKISESATLGTTDRFRIEGSAGPMRFRSHTTGGADEDEYTETVRVTTSNATPVALWTRVVPLLDVIMVDARVVAQSNTSGAHESAWYMVAGGARRYAAGNVTQIGTGAAITSGEEDAAWDAQIDVDVATQTIRLMVTGNSADTTTFLATVRYRRHSVA